MWFSTHIVRSIPEKVLWNLFYIFPRHSHSIFPSHKIHSTRITWYLFNLLCAKGVSNSTKSSPSEDFAIRSDMRKIFVYAFYRGRCLLHTHIMRWYWKTENAFWMKCETGIDISPSKALQTIIMHKCPQIKAGTFNSCVFRLSAFMGNFVADCAGIFFENKILNFSTLTFHTKDLKYRILFHIKLYWSTRIDLSAGSEQFL